MSSQRRTNASRRNGARSQGPKTPAGKRRSSENAIRHGLLAQRVVLENESEEHFQILLNQYVEKFDPADGVEFGMIEEMVASYWRLHRGFMIEKYLLDQALEKHDGTNLELLGKAWEELADSPKLHSLHRYQSMLHRMFQRALNNFLLLRDIGPEDTEMRNEPSPNSGHSDDPPPAPPAAPSATSSAPPAADSPASAAGHVNATPLSPAAALSQPVGNAGEPAVAEPKSLTVPAPDTVANLQLDRACLPPALSPIPTAPPLREPAGQPSPHGCLAAASCWIDLLKSSYTPDNAAVRLFAGTAGRPATGAAGPGRRPCTTITSAAGTPCWADRIRFPGQAV